MILLRRVALLGDLRHVEAELGSYVRRLVLRIEYGRAELHAQLRIYDSDGLVDRRVAGYVGSVMRQRAKRECIFVDIVALAQEFEDEIAAANVMDQIAEFFAAERIVTKILDDGAPIGISMGIAYLIVCESWVTREQERLDLVNPKQINYLFVRKNRVGMQTDAANE